MPTDDLKEYPGGRQRYWDKRAALERDDRPRWQRDASGESLAAMLPHVLENEALPPAPESKGAPVTREYALKAADHWLTKHGFDAREPANYQCIREYMADLRQGTAKQGLAIVGTVGTGKTTALKAVYRAIGNCQFYDATTLTFEHTKRFDDWEAAVWKSEDGGATGLVIDGMGDEPVLNDFGTKLELMIYIMDLRYRRWIDHGSLTFLTANIDVKELEGRYDERTLTRIQEMCQMVLFTGPNQRKVKHAE